MTEESSMPTLETKIRLYHEVSGQRELLAFADLVIGGAFVIKGLRVLMGKPKDDKPGGPFVAFPSRRGTGASQDKYFEIAHPITAQARQAARDLILQAYEAEAAKAAAAGAV